MGSASTFRLSSLAAYALGLLCSSKESHALKKNTTLHRRTLLVFLVPLKKCKFQLARSSLHVAPSTTIRAFLLGLASSLSSPSQPSDQAGVEPAFGVGVKPATPAEELVEALDGVGPAS